MSAIRYQPRSIALDELIRTLVAEHVAMREGLRRAKEATERRDFEDVSRSLKQLDGVFRQHIADEEAQILRLLIEELGVTGAEQEIKVFQQHRPIYQLMQTVSELASKEAVDLSHEQARLSALFANHVRMEEEQVFPHALKYLGKRISK